MSVVHVNSISGITSITTPSSSDVLTLHTSNNSERVRITSAGLVGIGTDAPGSMLHLVSASSPTIRVQDTTNNCLGLFFSQDSNTHVGTYSNHPLIFDTNSLPRLHISNTGYVGINSSIPQRRLTVTTANEDAILVRATSTAQYHSARIHLQAAGSATDNITALVHGNDNTGGSESYFAIESKNSSHSYIKTLALYKHSTDAWTFHTGTGSNGHERLKITSGGTIETKGYAGQCFKFNSDWSTGARNVQIWNAANGNWHSFVGTNLTWDGTNYIKPSDGASSNWGNIAGIVFEGANANNSSGNHPCIRFVADLPAENGLNHSLGSSKTNAIDQKTVGYFTPNKNFVINDGDLVVGTAGHGIDFSATGNPTNGASTSELLDYYEEGTFTPAFGGLSSVSYSTQFGKYTRIGRQVFCTAVIDATGIDESNNITLTGLPYSSTDSSDNQQRSTWLLAYGGHITGVSDATARFRSAGSSWQGVKGTASTSYLTGAQLSSTGTVNITGSFSYYVA